MDTLMPVATIKKMMVKEFDKPLRKGDIIGHDGYPPYYIYDGFKKLLEISCNGHTKKYEVSKDSFRNQDLDHFGYSLDQFSFHRYHLISNIYNKNAFIYYEKPKFELNKYVFTNDELLNILKEL
jgi:hypothetical protein